MRTRTGHAKVTTDEDAMDDLDRVVLALVLSLDLALGSHLLLLFAHVATHFLGLSLDSLVLGLVLGLLVARTGGLGLGDGAAIGGGVLLLGDSLLASATTVASGLGRLRGAALARSGDLLRCAGGDRAVGGAGLELLDDLLGPLLVYCDMSAMKSVWWMEGVRGVIGKRNSLMAPFVKE